MADWRYSAWAFLGACLLVLIAVPFIRTLACRLGAIDRPGGRRLHLRPVPRMGGLAVVAAVLTIAVLALLKVNPVTHGEPAISARWFILFGATLALLALGMSDDLAPVSPRVKLVAELAAGISFVAVFPVQQIDLGVVQIAGGRLISSLLVVLWIATITNAFNMIDGMDGLAGGIGGIAAAAMAFAALSFGDPTTGIVLLAVSGAMVAFLGFNGSPASIFLGDSGSIPIGFLLSSLGVVAFTRGGSWYSVPATIALAVPLLDLGVAITRRIFEPVHVVRHDESRERFSLKWRRAPQLFTADGRHIHHQLLTLGLTRRAAVLSLYGVGSLFAFLTLATGRWRYSAPIVFLLLVMGFGVLGSRWLYAELRLFKRGMLLPLFETSFVRSRIVHAAWDLAGFAAAFAAARWLVTVDWPGVGAFGREMWQRIALASAVAVLSYWAIGLYQISFRRAGQWVLIRAAVSVLFAAVMAASLDTVVFHSHFVWSCWLLTLYLAFTFTIFPRLTFRVFEAIHQRARKNGQRVVVLGAGKGGTAVLRELLDNPKVGMVPVAFVDDDPVLWHRIVEGYLIYPGGTYLKESLTDLGVSRLLVASTKVSDERMEQIRNACADLAVAVTCARITMEGTTSVTAIDSAEEMSAVAVWRA